MLELTDGQLQLLKQREHQDFCRRVHDQLISEFHVLDDDTDLLSRLKGAHDAALAFLLDSAISRTQFLYQEAFVPGFYRSLAIASWLRQPGAQPEQRWHDFMALVLARVEER